MMGTLQMQRQENQDSALLTKCRGVPEQDTPQLLPTSRLQPCVVDTAVGGG